MKVLLTGADGQVGWEIDRQAKDAGVDLIRTNRQSLDLADPASIERAFENDIGLVINAAAYTAVDKAESEPDIARAVNTTAPGLLAQHCGARQIPLIHFSTDYVFDGAATRAWVEEDPTAPLGVYGDTKLGGEQAIRAALDRHVILRTSWVFGVHGHNFVKTMLRLANERDELTVVADQIGCPTFAGTLAAAALHIAGKLRLGGSPWGTYHLCDDGPTTWHAFAARIIALGHAAGQVSDPPAIKPIRTEDYPTPAQRPAYSVLNTARFTRTFPAFRLRPWQDGVHAILAAQRNEA